MTYLQRLKQYEAEKEKFTRDNPLADHKKYQSYMIYLANKWGI